MVEAEYTAHRSMVLAVREAVALCLLDQNCEEDIIKISACFAAVDAYQGDRIPISIIVQEIDYLCNVLQDNYLGLKIHSLVNIRALPFYKAINECVKPFSNVNEELPFLLISRLVFCFFFLVTESIDLKLIPEKGLLRFELIPNDPNLMNKHQIDGVMVNLYRIIEAFCPGRLERLYVAQRNSSHELQYYQSIFDVPVECANKSSLVYDLQCKDHYKNATHLLIKSEEELGRKFFINPLFNMLSTQFSGFSYKERCEIVIDTTMCMSPPTRNHVADSMNMSVSTLKRRLNEESTSFQEVLEEARKRLAQMYLTEKNLTTTDIAYLLGYKSHSQFFTAFKIWFGMTPKAYQSSIVNQIEDHCY